MESLHALCDSECMGYLLMSHPDQTIIMLNSRIWRHISRTNKSVCMMAYNRRSVICGETFPIALPFISMAAKP